MLQRLIFSSLFLGVAISLDVLLVSGDEVPARPNGPPPAKEKLAALPKAVIDGTGLGWTQLGQDDFVIEEADKDLWTWKNDVLRCHGKASMCRSKKVYTNFELVLEWRLHTYAGNSGIFVWAEENSVKSLKPRGATTSIEVQILDHGYTEVYEKQTKAKTDWFTTHGDVFAVGEAKMTPFPPVGARGSRSFPRKNLSKGLGEWNHYYIRAINGEIRLWVNGEEVSGGTDITPRSGCLGLEHCNPTPPLISATFVFASCPDPGRRGAA